MDSPGPPSKSDKVWANVGRFAVVVGIVAGVTKVGFDIADRMSGPHLTGWVRVSEYHVNPDLQERFEPRVNFNWLSNVVESAIPDTTKHSGALSNISQSVNTASLKGLVDFNMFMTEHPSEVQVRIENKGSRPAHDVKIVYSGRGKAEIVINPSSRDPAFAWTNSIPIGELNPDTGVEVLIWPSGAQFWSFDQAATLTAVHSVGSVRLYRVHEFVGATADFSFWYNRRGWIQQTAITSVILLPLLFFVNWFPKKLSLLLYKRTQSKE